MDDNEKEMTRKYKEYLADKSPTKRQGSKSSYRMSARLDGWILFLIIAYAVEPSDALIKLAIKDKKNE